LFGTSKLLVAAALCTHQMEYHATNQIQKSKRVQT
jgi:hypothetical protein